MKTTLKQLAALVLAGATFLPAISTLANTTTSSNQANAPKMERLAYYYYVRHPYRYHRFYYRHYHYYHRYHWNRYHYRHYHRYYWR